MSVGAHTVDHSPVNLSWHSVELSHWCVNGGLLSWQLVELKVRLLSCPPDKLFDPRIESAKFLLFKCVVLLCLCYLVLVADSRSAVMAVWAKNTTLTQRLLVSLAYNEHHDAADVFLAKCFIKFHQRECANFWVECSWQRAAVSDNGESLGCKNVGFYLRNYFTALRYCHYLWCQMLLFHYLTRSRTPQKGLLLELWGSFR